MLEASSLKYGVVIRKAILRVFSRFSCRFQATGRDTPSNVDNQCRSVVSGASSGLMSSYKTNTKPELGHDAKRGTLTRT
jgi:hypothetical protein